MFRGREGGVYATQAACPNKGGPLADGLLVGGTLICPLHSLKFDLSTGRAQSGDCTLRVYPTEVTAQGQLRVLL